MRKQWTVQRKEVISVYKLLDVFLDSNLGVSFVAPAGWLMMLL